MMTKEEFDKAYCDMKEYSIKAFNRIKEKLISPEKMSLEDMGELVDMLKDLSEVQKNITKAHHYAHMSGHSSGEVL